MSLRNIILMLIAGVFAVGTVMVVRNRMETPLPRQTAAVPSATRILVARRDISVGSFVKSQQDLQWADWPAASIQPSYVKEGSEDIHAFEGAIARQSIHAGEAIPASQLIKPGSGGFLSAVLDSGMRAVSVAVSATSGTAGFIFPGDRVDLIVTHHVKLRSAPGAEEEDKVVGETFVKDVRVVAVDQLLDNPDNKAILAKTVTVEVTSDEAQRISVAEDMGKISFALRSLSTDAATPPSAPVKLEGAGKDNPDLISELTQSPSAQHADRGTQDSDISPALMHRSDISPRVRVIRGDQNEQREFDREGQ